jgi:hypothetical protein
MIRRDDGLTWLEKLNSITIALLPMIAKIPNPYENLGGS